MRPVLMNPTPGYAIPDAMTTRTKIIMDGLNDFGIPLLAGNGTTTGTYATAQVLDLMAQLTVQNNGADKWSGLPQKTADFINALIAYFSTNDNVKYGNARGALIDNYGEYCSYCGMPVQDSSLAVEHCLPKQVFPSQMLYYTNFFLSCPTCNSYKGAKPTWSESYNWANMYNGTPTNLTDVMNGGMQRQVWPNTGTITWAGLPVVYFNASAGSRLSDNSALDFNNRMVGISRNIVVAKIVGFAQPIAVVAQVGTNSGGNSPDKPKLQAMEDNFIDIVQLNQYEMDNYSDRRVTNRTVAWLNCITSLSNLQRFTPGSEGWNLMLGQIFQTAKNAGFFEIWSWIFYMVSGPAVNPSIYLLFRSVSCDPGQPLYYFPGTNINNLPIL